VLKLKEIVFLRETDMSGSDMSMYNQMYKNIERPYANVDLSKIPSWDLVMTIMEQQALEARRQILAKYHAQAEQMMPQTITNFEYHSSSNYNYAQNGNNSTEESDNSSCCSDEMMSASSQSDLSQSESDIEIDVDSIEEEENDDYFMSSLDNIPTTVLQLETKLREKELKQS
jgi:hypothetical protein